MCFEKHTYVCTYVRTCCPLLRGERGSAGLLPLISIRESTCSAVQCKTSTHVCVCVCVRVCESCVRESCVP